MKLKTLFLIAAVFTYSSCGEKRGGKLRRINYPTPNFQEEREVDESKPSNIRLTTLRAKSLEMSLEREGLVDSRELERNSRRYLRDKALNFTFINIVDQVDKKTLNLTSRDEFRFFPNELSVESKMTAMKSMASTNSETGRWNLQGVVKWDGLRKNDKIENIVITLGNSTRNERHINSYGADLLRGKNGIPIVYKEQSGKINFELAYSKIPVGMMKKIAEPNSDLFLEVKDFQLNNKKMTDYLLDSRIGKVRLVVSLPYGERMFFLNKGQSVVEFLEGVDPTFELGYDGKLLSLFGSLQDDSISYPDRNMIQEDTHYGDSHFWWTNIEGELADYKADDKTIVLSYFSLKEIRSSQYIWEPTDFEFKDKFSTESLNAHGLMGAVQKKSISYQYKENSKVIPFEIGTRHCIEDDVRGGRHDRKASGCYIK